ncbi:MAG TPA: hypothetical protein VFA09_13570 [Ktedonobacteraceae bacterium]|nr:hypothetical protein [Ktedonobacteraceae bacterium]
MSFDNQMRNPDEFFNRIANLSDPGRVMLSERSRSPERSEWGRISKDEKLFAIFIELELLWLQL